jgi:hypothetical protein
VDGFLVTAVAATALSLLPSGQSVDGWKVTGSERACYLNATLQGGTSVAVFMSKERPDLAALALHNPTWSSLTPGSKRDVFVWIDTLENRSRSAVVTQIAGQNWLVITFPQRVLGSWFDHGHNGRITYRTRPLFNSVGLDMRRAITVLRQCSGVGADPFQS